MSKERKPLSATVMQRFVSDPNSVAANDSPTNASLSSIELPEKGQPRRYFDPEKMEQLVTSVKKHGVLEPILVRPLKNGNYELVAGERRLRAAKKVGLAEIPIISRELSDQEALHIALVENLQRDDLNPVEETEAVLELLAIDLEASVEDVKSIIYQAANARNRGQELKENVFLQVQTIEECLKELGRFSLESLRTSRLPLLNLPPKILEALRAGQLEYTKARAIARIKNEEHRDELLEEAIAKSLSLNAIKAQIKELKAPDIEKTPKQTLVNRMADLTKRIKKSKAWDNQERYEQITKLLDELEQLSN